MVDDELSMDVRTNLRAVLSDIKKMDKSFATGTRKAIRESGEVIIHAQAQILDSENPGRVTGRVYRQPVKPSRGGIRSGRLAKNLGGARLADVYGAGATGKSDRHTRQRIRDGLKVRSGRGTERYGGFAKVATTNNSNDIPAKGFNAKIVRHPVFGQDIRAEQKGLQYFSRGVAIGARAARQRLLEVTKDALAEIRSNPPLD